MSEWKYIKQIKKCVYSGGIYLETAEWRWGCDAKYKQERMHGEM